LEPSISSTASKRRLEVYEVKRGNVAGSVTASPGLPALNTVGICAVYRPARSCWRTPGYVCASGSSTAGWNRVAEVAVTAALPSSPLVMLSPNARNLVIGSLAGATTVTGKLQVSVRCKASVAVHVTVEAPTLNTEPDAGVHTVTTGALPFTVVAAPYVTGTAIPVIDCTICAAGHMSLGGSGTGVGGGVGVGAAGLPQPARTKRLEAKLVSSRT